MSGQPTHNDWAPLTRLFGDAYRQKSARALGLEVERLGLWEDGYTLQYHTQKDSKGQPRPGARELLLALKAHHQWEPVTNREGDILGFHSPTGKVSLEPGSQLEFSADPQPDLPTLIKTMRDFEQKVEEITRPWGLYWTGIGVNPFHTADEIELIPSPRYRIMTEYLPQKGRLATSMMRLTTSIQINLDYSSEIEAIEMLKTAMAVAPISYALFGNSPIARGAESGLLSFRGAIWKNTDPDRAGLFAHAFSKGFDFDQYAKHLWQYPLMFAENAQGEFVAANGASLSQLVSGPNPLPLGANLMHAVRELFTEARLKPGYVEVRSIDGLRPDLRYAATAFWTGLLYSEGARQLALELLSPLIPSLLDQAMTVAIHTGLKGKVGPLLLRDAAKALADAAREGLKARGLNEESYLEPVFDLIERAQNPAGRLLEMFQGEWRRNLAPLVRYSGLEN